MSFKSAKTKAHWLFRHPRVAKKPSCDSVRESNSKAVASQVNHLPTPDCPGIEIAQRMMPDRHGDLVWNHLHAITGRLLRSNLLQTATISPDEYFSSHSMKNFHSTVFLGR